jgi:hypothetical protein
VIIGRIDNAERGQYGGGLRIKSDSAPLMRLGVRTPALVSPRVNSSETARWAGAGGDAVTIPKGFLGGQGIASLEDPALDGTTEVGGNSLVRAVVIGWLSRPTRRRKRFPGGG